MLKAITAIVLFGSAWLLTLQTNLDGGPLLKDYHGIYYVVVLLSAVAYLNICSLLLAPIKRKPEQTGEQSHDSL